MKVTPSFQNISEFKPFQTIKKVLPEKIVLPECAGELAKRAGRYINTPEQKLFIAGSTLAFTPLIDLKFADEDKKTDAAIKSASKAIAGGITGVSIRAGFQFAAKKLINFESNNIVSLCFIPKSARDMLQEKPAEAIIRLDQYCKTMGTLCAVIFMILFSNSKLDVPLTSDLQDLISGVVKENKTWIASLADVSQNRKSKIKAWFNKKKNKIVSIKNKAVNIVKIIQGKNIEQQEVKKQE